MGLWTNLGRVCLGAGAGRILLCVGVADELVGNKSEGCGKRVVEGCGGGDGI